MKSKLYILLLILVCLTFVMSCRTKQTYYYSEDGKNKQTINEISDSAAYMKAFLNFQISKKIYLDEKSVNPNIRRKEPRYFTLYDSQNKDITTSVTFAKKDSLEQNVIHRMKKMQNILMEEIEKSKNID